MTSALTQRGSTTAWRRLRHQYALALADAWTTGTIVECRICRGPITAGQAWDLGHHTPRARGGDDRNLAPEHASCNRAAGANIRRVTTYVNPDW